ncbi:MAG: hypothetical protein ACYCSF_01105 [Acidimicrobiales bacterium]
MVGVRSNGLVAANILADHGLEVLVLEDRRAGPETLAASLRTHEGRPTSLI